MQGVSPGKKNSCTSSARKKKKLAFGSQSDIYLFTVIARNAINGVNCPPIMSQFFTILRCITAYEAKTQAPSTPREKLGTFSTEVFAAAVRSSDVENWIESPNFRAKQRASAATAILQTVNKLFRNSFAVRNDLRHFH